MSLLITPFAPELFHLFSQQPLRLNYFNMGLLLVMLPWIHTGIPVKSWMQYVINRNARVFSFIIISFGNNA